MEWSEWAATGDSKGGPDNGQTVEPADVIWEEEPGESHAPGCLRFPTQFASNPVVQKTGSTSLLFRRFDIFLLLAPSALLSLSYHLAQSMGSRPKSHGEEEAERKSLPGYRTRRWVVERTHSWPNRFRRRLVRWEKKPDNYLTMLDIACAFIAFRAAGILG